MMTILNNLSVAGKTYLISTVFMAGMVCIGVTSAVLMNGVEHEMIEIAEEDVPLIRALTKVTVSSLEQAILVEKVLPQHKSSGEAGSFYSDFSNRADQNRLAFAEALELTGKAEELAATPEALLRLREVGRQVALIKRDYETYLEKAERIFQKAESGEEISLAERDEITEIQKKVDRSIEEELFKVEAFAEAAAKRAKAHGNNVIWSIIVVSIVASILGVIACWLLIRAVAQPLRIMSGTISEMAKGNDVEVPCLGNGDEIGVLARSLDQVLQKGLEAARLRQALDRCTTMVMVANRRDEIVYVNPSLRDHLQRHERAINAEVPGFATSQLMGGNVDIFRNSPTHSLGIDGSLQTSKAIDLKIGGRRLHADINPVLNEDGAFLGTVVEWDDNTDDLTMRESIDRMVGAVGQGDFEARIDTASVGEDHRKVAEGMNGFAKQVDDATRDLARILAALADGDLTQRIDKDYQGRFGELQQSANQTADQLSTIVAQIQSSAGELTNAASEITSGTEDLSQRTEQAAANLEETAASTEEMSATVKQNADNAKSASGLASVADQSAKTGGQVVEQAVNAMAGIESSAQKITDIISVIDEIAFQTNLLALNASVEAARAGEAGKGFAVVAQEVRQLAQRSAQAASDIKNVINDSNGQVKDGVQLVNQAGEALTEIVGSIGKVAEIVQEIASASEEQSVGVQEINKSISSMDEMTQQNSALVEESSASSRILGEQASKLNELMVFFKLKGGAPVAQSRPRSSISRAKPAHAQSRTPAPAPMAKAGADDRWDEF